MKILSWNCQRLGSKSTISYLKEIWSKHKPSFFSLSETKNQFDFFQSFQFHFGYSHLHKVDPRGRSGGLALFYDTSYKVNIISSDNRIIDVETELEGKQIFISFIYGESNQSPRDQVWEWVTRIGIVRDQPWFIIGDLNEIRGNHEKEGGVLRHADTFLLFNNMIENCGLLVFPSLGNTLSWMIGSDLRPNVASIDNRVIKFHRQFRFDKRWIGEEGLMESIERGWNSWRRQGEVGFVDKIHNCRHEISVWRKANPPYGKEKN